MGASTHTFRLALSMAAALSLTAAATAQRCTPEWSALSTGMTMETTDPAPGTVATLAVHDDGNGPALYAGGVFTVAGGASASKVAKWDGQAWSPLGVGMEYNSLVFKLISFNGSLYAAGTFISAGGFGANRVARWDGTAWHALGTGTSGQANAMAVFDDGNGPVLYVGGTFTSAGGTTVNRIAKWDGDSWQPLGTGIPSSFVNVLFTFNGSLYVGGGFTSAGGVAANKIARWDGAAWSAVGAGSPLTTATGNVNDFAAFDTGNGPELYAGGSFGIIRWNGSAWVEVPGGPGASALAVHDGSLYTGGGFASIGSLCTNNIARWDGTTWHALDKGLYSNANAMTVFNGALHVSGQFLSASGVPNTTRVARWGCP